ncbi:MAG TPA: hypothetical protein VKT83_03390 [bacterium]|nr:hypothetical protein [bacterium]
MTQRNRSGPLLALALYLLTSFLYFGRRVAANPSGSYIGFSGDPISFMWMLKWWPFAIAHHLDPFVNERIWSSLPVSLAWASSILGPALLAAGITTAFGPVVSFNVVMWAAPALSAWTAYLLCVHVTKARVPSLVAGYLYGFSSYELGHMLGHPNLVLIFLVPLAVYVLLLYGEGRLSTTTFVALFALILVAQFTFFVEIFAMDTAFGVAAAVLGCAFADRTTRRAILAAAPAVVSAYAVALLLLSPYLYRFADRSLSVAIDFPHSADLLNLVVPMPPTWVGGRAFASLSGRFTGNVFENGAYLGVPLLLACVLFIAGGWRRPVTRVLAACAALVLVASLGPTLRVAGRPVAPLPWALILHVPLVNQALPARFPMFLSLITALMVAAWLSRPGPAAWLRWTVAGAAVLSVLPNPAFPLWTTDLHTPEFFSAGLYRRAFAPSETVLIIPYGLTGQSLLWQAQSDMYFRMPGYIVRIPPKFVEQWPIAEPLLSTDPRPSVARHLAPLRDFRRYYQIRSVVVTSDEFERAWAPVLSAAEGPPKKIGGVFLYQHAP